MRIYEDNWDRAGKCPASRSQLTNSQRARKAMKTGESVHRWHPSNWHPSNSPMLLTQLRRRENWLVVEEASHADALAYYDIHDIFIDWLRSRFSVHAAGASTCFLSWNHEFLLSRFALHDRSKRHLLLLLLLLFWFFSVLKCQIGTCPIRCFFVRMWKEQFWHASLLFFLFCFW